MTQEQAELVPPDIDEMSEFGIQIPPVRVESEAESEGRRVKAAKTGRPQNTKRLSIPKKTKILLVKTRGGMCEECKEEVYQQIHHIDGDPRNNDPVNLMLICYECHKEIEKRKRKQKIEVTLD